MQLARRQGQTTIDIAVTISVVVVGLVALAIYVRRGYQGYLHENASSIGAQFDPTLYDERRNILLTQSQDVTVTTGLAAVEAFKGDIRLPSVPGGVLPTRVLGTKVKVVTNWDVCRQEGYGGAALGACP